jgi:nitroimidazol reductase NimA-like FMN-containing flavoprotein (pyridoxamine 5'-phosphate oxidase superfamily)
MNHPTVELIPSTLDHTEPTDWEQARQRLSEGGWYWLATTRPDGTPHVRPVLAVWVDDALYFVSNADTRKAKNLADFAACAITKAAEDMHLVVEGRAVKVRDDATLQLVADAYAAQQGWNVIVRDGAFVADGAPTAGPPPYDVYEVAPTTVYAFGTDERFSPTRWRF